MWKCSLFCRIWKKILITRARLLNPLYISTEDVHKKFFLNVCVSKYTSTYVWLLRASLRNRGEGFLLCKANPSQTHLNGVYPSRLSRYGKYSRLFSWSLVLYLASHGKYKHVKYLFNPRYIYLDGKWFRIIKRIADRAVIQLEAQPTLSRLEVK